MLLNLDNVNTTGIKYLNMSKVMAVNLNRDIIISLLGVIIITLTLGGLF